MTLALSPQLEQLIEEHMTSGNYATPEAVVEAALTELSAKKNSALLYDDDWVAIAEADAEGERGEGVDLDTFRAQMAKQYQG